MKADEDNSLMEKINTPVESFQSYFKQTHHENIVNFFDKMVEMSKIDIDANRLTNKKITENDKRIAGNEKAIKWQKIFKTFAIILMIISVLAIVFCVIKFNFNWVVVLAVGLIGFSIFIIIKTKKRLDELYNIEGKLLKISKKLHAEAEKQMRPLNNLLYKNYNTELFTKTIPLVQFDETFLYKRLYYMEDKFGFNAAEDEFNMEKSTLFVQSGEIKGNPFFIRDNLQHTMGTKVYEGSLRISWETIEKDSSGNVKTVNHSQTLYASVEKPCPYYFTLSSLVYANETVDRLSFSRQPSNIHELKERKVERFIKKKSKDIRKMAEYSTLKGGTFTALGNNEFDALFYAIDRDNEAQFRLLFTPFAQLQLTKILKDNSVGYGDDFVYEKRKKITYIYPKHLNHATLNVQDDYFVGINYDLMRENFITYHNSYFKEVFFTFAPLFAVPLYMQHQPHEYIYKDSYKSYFSFYQHEMVVNCINIDEFEHPTSVTPNIVKTSLVKSSGNVDTISVTTWGYRTEERIDYESVYGGDGMWHDVPVHWDKYIKVTRERKIEVKDSADVKDYFGSQSTANWFKVGRIYARIVK